MVPERPLKVLATRRPAGGLVAAKPQPEEPWAGVPVAVWAGFLDGSAAWRRAARRQLGSACLLI